MQSRKEFLEGRLVDLPDGRRLPGIGSSDIAGILGYDPYRTPRDVWLRIRGFDLDRESAERTEPDLLRGILLEERAASEFFKASGLRGRRMETRRHPEYDFLIASPDRQLFARTPDEGSGSLEVKVPRSSNYFRWVREGIPERVLLQAQFQAALAGYDWGFVWAWTPDAWEGLPFEYALEVDLAEVMLAKAVDFWESYVVPDREPPPLVEPDPDIDVPPGTEGTVTIVDGPSWAEEFSNLGRLYDEKRDSEKAWNEAKAKFGKVLEELELEAVEAPGLGRVIYRPTTPGTTFDETALRDAFPLDPEKARAYLPSDFPIGDFLRSCTLDLDEARFRKAKRASRPFKFYPSKG